MSKINLLKTNERSSLSCFVATSNTLRLRLTCVIYIRAQIRAFDFPVIKFKDGITCRNLQYVCVCMHEKGNCIVISTKLLLHWHYLNCGVVVAARGRDPWG